MTDRDRLLQRISVAPQVCFGRPCIRGTRIWVSLIVDNLAEGISEAELLAAYPQLQSEDIRAALVYAAERLASIRLALVSATSNRENRTRRWVHSCHRLPSAG